MILDHRQGEVDRGVGGENSKKREKSRENGVLQRKSLYVMEKMYAILCRLWVAIATSWSGTSGYVGWRESERMEDSS